ncbi:putative endonuclease [Tamaricihabitans halophyticus]|uniref:UPF0102 protein EV191_106127 n=1 Tax=Tamaricihabitans halophyticus TaxID=1262583 RepID=A0A4R2QQE6_9PSEU|nr:YraN family protein [Tamaricihabitans halophyticus]TCP51963.1 putative endonuclease [Tamaricihabitans halophyticus]
MVLTGNGQSGYNNILGERGELLAARHLRARGLTVLARNWRCSDGELDLVAGVADRLVVCEVKTRTGAAFGRPGEAVTAAKARRIRRLTSLWLANQRASWNGVRFDVIEILLSAGEPPRITHHEDVF